MSAIFHDLRDACYFPKIVQGQPEQIDWSMYENMSACTLKFIAEVFAQVEQQLSLEQQNRTGKFFIALGRLGWKLFAICAHSRAFRTAIDALNDTDWDSILTLIDEEKRSIEIFARSRDLDWRGILLPYAGDQWPGLEEALTPDINLATGHPHHIVQTEDGGLRQPVFPWTEDGELQSSMHGNFLHPSFPDETAPAGKRNENFRKCFLCLKNTCEFNGVVMPKPLESDIWSMEWTTQKRDEDGTTCYKYYPNIIVDPTRLGSWTRYSNHHCDQNNARPIPAVVGDRPFLGFITLRDISVFEEVTITYGPNYWIGRGCKCGGVKCVSLLKTQLDQINVFI
ncbi:unnamed protein product [Penicillium manginii]